MSGGYVLKFISGKYQGGEFPLEMNTEIVIGRSSELDMVLVEDMVSRRHARITTYNSELAIEDFGSTNGTFVNGERISKARLKEGDRILVGTNIIKLVHLDTLDSGMRMPSGELPHAQPNITMPPHQPNGMPNKTMTGTISGLIDEVPLPDLLQLFSTSKKNGVLVIHSDDDVGKVFLRTGRVFFATINDDMEISPYKAFYRMMAWKSGHFSLEHSNNESFENEINESIEGLMMEGMRILDEMLNLGPDVPELNARISIPRPLTAPLRSLQPEQLDVFQLAYNNDKVSQILNKSEEGDLEAMRAVLHLIRNHYLVLP